MKKKILHHTSIMIIFAVLVTFLAASVVTYNKLNTYMQRGVREEAQYICLAMDEYGDSFLTKKLRKHLCGQRQPGKLPLCRGAHG